MLSIEEFEDLVRYVSDNVDHDLDRYAMRMIEGRNPLPYELVNQINDYAEEWCNNNNIDPDEFYGDYDAEDIFMHDAYDFDA